MKTCITLSGHAVARDYQAEFYVALELAELAYHAHGLPYQRGLF